jgi:hypothetical protein
MAAAISAANWHNNLGDDTRFDFSISQNAPTRLAHPIGRWNYLGEANEELCPLKFATT